MVFSCTWKRDIHEELPNIHTELKTERFLVLEGGRWKRKWEKDKTEISVYSISRRDREEKSHVYGSI